jgi:hypothetical protein
VTTISSKRPESTSITSPLSNVAMPGQMATGRRAQIWTIYVREAN